MADLQRLQDSLTYKGLPTHLRTVWINALERVPNAWLFPPQTGEIFEGVRECKERLQAWALFESFAVVMGRQRKDGTPNWQFRCVHHGIDTRNDRGLEQRVVKDENGVVISKRQRNVDIQKLDCKFEYMLSYKCASRGKGSRLFIGTLKEASHYGHSLHGNPFKYDVHETGTVEYQFLTKQAQKYRAGHQSYANACELLDLECQHQTLTAKTYYNLLRNLRGNRDDPRTMTGLLTCLRDENFQFRTRTVDTIDSEGRSISRRLEQVFFIHPDAVRLGQRFCAAHLLVLDGTFNTNRHRMPLLVAVGVTNSGKTFPLAFSYCPGETAQAYLFFFNCLRECVFLNDICEPGVILADQSPGLQSAVDTHRAAPQSSLQFCNWHMVQAMIRKWRESGYTREQIEGKETRQSTLQDRLRLNSDQSEATTTKAQKKLLFSGQLEYQDNFQGPPLADIEHNSFGGITPGLSDLSWRYILSDTQKELDTNREILLASLKPTSQLYISENMISKEHRVIHSHTRQLPNLGASATQRVEGWNPIIHSVTHGQLSLEESCKRLITKLNNVYKSLSTDEDKSTTHRSAPLDRNAFRFLIGSVSLYCIKLIEPEWLQTQKAVEEGVVDLGPCGCDLLAQFSLPCRHYLLRAAQTGEPIPKSLIHPRWWLAGPPITSRYWQPTYTTAIPLPHSPRRVLAIQTMYDVMDKMENLQGEEAARYNLQIATSNNKLLEIGDRHVELAALPIGVPDVIPARAWKRATNKVDSRALTGAEIAEKAQLNLAKAARSMATAQARLNKAQAAVPVAIRAIPEHHFVVLPPLSTEYINPQIPAPAVAEEVVEAEGVDEVEEEEEDIYSLPASTAPAALQPPNRASKRGRSNTSYQAAIEALRPRPRGKGKGKGQGKGKAE